MVSIGSAKKRTKESSYKIIKFFNNISFGQVFLYWFLLILVFGAVYFSLSMTPNHTLMYQGEVIALNTKGFVNSMYFSFITATSLGYGDVAPLGISKFLSGFEVVLGLIIYGVLISKIVGVKQEIILEEVYDISYEEVIDRLRSELYLFRANVNRVLEKIETGNIKQREVKDLWTLFSNMTNTLTKIKHLMVPKKVNKYYYKKLDVFRLELFLNSIRLSMDKILELIKTLQVHEIDWKTELLITSIDTDTRLVNDIIEFQSKKSNDKKVVDKLNELKNTIEEIEKEVKVKEILGEKNKKDEKTKRKKIN